MRIQYVCDRHFTYTRRKRMNITQTKLWTKLSCVYKYNVIKVTVCPQLWTYPYNTVRLGCPQLWTKIPVHKHITPIRLERPLLWTKTPSAYVSCQLGWIDHHFGQKKPYTNISRYLGWGVHHFGQKSPCAHISCQLGWGVHYGQKTYKERTLIQMRILMITELSNRLQ